MSNSNNNNNNNNNSSRDMTDDILLSLLSRLPCTFSGTANNHASSQGKGRSNSLNHICHDSINGVMFFQDVGANKRDETSFTKNDDPNSFLVNLNDTSEPSRQDMARRNKFVEKRRNRAGKHIFAYAERLLSEAMQIEAELDAPQDQQDEFVAVINERSTSRRTFPSARISERHHFALAADIMDELDDEDMHYDQ